jgi:hypothetical protein
MDILEKAIYFSFIPFTHTVITFCAPVVFTALLSWIMHDCGDYLGCYRHSLGAVYSHFMSLFGRRDYRMRFGAPVSLHVHTEPQGGLLFSELRD